MHLLMTSRSEPLSTIKKSPGLTIELWSLPPAPDHSLMDGSGKVDQVEKQLYIAGSLGRTACCPALGCVADAGLGGSPQGRGFTACSDFSVGGLPIRKQNAQGHRIDSNRALAFGTEPKLVWGKEGVVPVTLFPLKVVCCKKKGLKSDG